MSKLYIIGNGFDRGHGLKTSYWNFREYLEKYEEDFLVQMERMYDFAPFERKDNRNRKNKKRQKWRDDALYQYLWQSFEFELSHANEVEMEERSQSLLEVIDLDGGLTPYCKEKPILGHGNVDIIDVYQEKAKRADDEFDEGSKSIYHAIAKFYERIFKDTNQQINKHRDFFRNLADITSVNIIEHSMSEVDLPYFQAVQLYSPEKMTWNIYYFNKDEQDSMKERLLSIGVMKEEIYMRDAKEFWD